MSNMVMKRILALFLISVLMFTVGCSNENTSSENLNNLEEVKEEPKEEVKEEPKEEIIINIASPVGAPTLSMIKMFKDNLTLGSNSTVIYESVKSPDLMASKIISGEIDIAIVPSNLAIKLYNKGIDYKYAGAGVWGVLYIASTEDLNGWEDLKGKEINMIGRGLTPDIVTRYLLKANGLEPDVDVTFNYVNGSTDLAQLFISGKSTLSILPEPMLSKVMMKKSETKIILDLQEEWKKASGGSGSYPQAAIMIKNELIENHPEIVDEFLAKYEESINWANENPTDAGLYSEEFKTGLSVQLVEKAMERTNLMFKNSVDSEKDLVAYYEVLFNFSADSIGGKLPDDNFYYKK